MRVSLYWRESSNGTFCSRRHRALLFETPLWSCVASDGLAGNWTISGGKGSLMPATKQTGTKAIETDALATIALGILKSRYADWSRRVGAGTRIWIERGIANAHALGLTESHEVMLFLHCTVMLGSTLDCPIRDTQAHDILEDASRPVAERLRSLIRHALRQHIGPSPGTKESPLSRRRDHAPPAAAKLVRNPHETNKSSLT